MSIGPRDGDSLSEFEIIAFQPDTGHAAVQVLTLHTGHLQRLHVAVSQHSLRVYGPRNRLCNSAHSPNLPTPQAPFLRREARFDRFASAFGFSREHDPSCRGSGGVPQNQITSLGGRVGRDRSCSEQRQPRPPRGNSATFPFEFPPHLCFNVSVRTSTPADRPERPPRRSIKRKRHSSDSRRKTFLQTNTQSTDVGRGRRRRPWSL